MITDAYGQTIITEQDLCDIYLRDPERRLTTVVVDKPIIIPSDLDLKSVPKIVTYVQTQESIEDYDRRLQSQWLMPVEYQEMDIAKWLLEQCQTDAERQRVGQELLLYLDRNLFPLLQYLKYLVDTMRLHKIVWGVGRGSSVSSYVLYLIGIHRINSMYFDLEITDFLK